MIEMFALTIKEISVGENRHFIRNAFLHMTHEMGTSFNKIFHAHGNLEQFQKISSLLKIDNLNISNEKELFHLVKIIATITLRNLVEKFAKNISDDEALNNYSTEINLLKKGLYKTTSD